MVVIRMLRGMTRLLETMRKFFRWTGQEVQISFYFCLLYVSIAFNYGELSLKDSDRTSWKAVLDLWMVGVKLDTRRQFESSSC